MKKTLLLSFLLCVVISLSAQDAKKAETTVQTKMDSFTSKTGAITKVIDNKLPALKTSYATCETRIRTVKSGTLSAYFYQIEKEGKYGSATASIEYSDLLEVIKALNVLKAAVDGDMAANPDYLENKFITVDGFQIGYYISKGKNTWYIKLEKYGSDNTLFIDDINLVDKTFNEAKTKIEALKK